MKEKNIRERLLEKKIIRKQKKKIRERREN